MANNRINFSVGYTVDKTGLQDLKQSLREVQKAGEQAANGVSMEAGLKESCKAAQQLESILDDAWNSKLGELNLSKVNQGIKTTFGSVNNLRTALEQSGKVGSDAYNQVASSILNTNLQLKQSNKLLDDMATSMANTVKWGITSSIFNNLTGSIQKAFYFVKDLDSSLNDIRIVTNKSTEDMEAFAISANKAAKALAASTVDYTDASLIYYQQGLSDEDVAARAETTLKAANVTGQAGEEVSELLTAVWNGYKVSADEAELYIDKLAAVAATTASDLEELSVGMSKVASAANLMGVDVDQLNAQLATIVSVTRQAPESVGTALKTIYARMGDIEAGLDADVSLGYYTELMAEMGFNVLNMNGELRDMGEVIEEIGGKWQSMTREQQISLSQTMAGTRQYNNLLSLFDNWEMYIEALQTSANAAGTLQHQQDIYMESTRAHLKQLKAEAEETYNTLLDADTVNTFADIFTYTIGEFNDFINGLGGGTEAIVKFGAMAANVFNQQIARGITSTINNVKALKNNLESINLKKSISQDAINSISLQRESQGTINSTQASLEKEAKIAQEILKVRQSLTSEQYNELTNLQQQIGLDEIKLSNARNYYQLLEKIAGANQLSLEALQRRLESEKESVNTYKNYKIDLEEVSLRMNELSDNQKRNSDLAKMIADEYEETLKAAIYALEEQDAEIADISTFYQWLEGSAEERKSAEGFINDLLQDQKKLYQQSSDTVEQLEEAVKQRKFLESEEYQVLLKQQQAREEILKQQIKQAANEQKIARGIQISSGIIEGIASGVSSLPVLFDESAEKADKMKASFSEASGILSSIANMVYPGSGIIISGLMQILNTSVDIIQTWKKNHSPEVLLQKYNEELEKGAEITKEFQKDKNELVSIAEEFGTLAEKAGEYGENVKFMTEEEQERYYELLDIILAHNSAAIEGYDAEGKAIVNNNELLKETLRIRQEDYRIQMAGVYTQENLAKLENQYRKERNEALKKYLSLQASYEADKEAGSLKVSAEGQYHIVRGFLTSGILSGETIQNFNDEQKNELDALLTDLENAYDDNIGLEGISKVVNEQGEAILDAEGKVQYYNYQAFVLLDRLRLISDLYTEVYGEQSEEVKTLSSHIETLQASLDNYSNALIEGAEEPADLIQARSDYKNASLYNAEDLLEYLQFNVDYGKYYQALADEGVQNLETAVLSFLNSKEWHMDKYSLEDIAEEGANFVELLHDAFVEDGILYNLRTNPLNPEDYASFEEYKTALLEQINTVLASSGEELQALMAENPEFQNLLPSMLMGILDLTGVSVEVDDTGNLVATAIETALDKQLDAASQTIADKIGAKKEEIRAILATLYDEGTISQRDLITTQSSLEKLLEESPSLLENYELDLTTLQEFITAIFSEIQLLDDTITTFSDLDVDNIIKKVQEHEELTEDELKILELIKEDYVELGQIQDKNSHAYLQALRNIREQEEANNGESVKKAKELAEAKVEAILAQAKELEDGLVIVPDTEQFENALQELQDANYAVQVQVEADLKTDIEDAFGLAEEINRLKDIVNQDLKISIDQAQEIIRSGFGAILTNAQATSENMILLDQAVVNSFISGKESEIEQDRLSKIEQLKHQKELLTSQLEILLAKQQALQSAADAELVTDKWTKIVEAQNLEALYQTKVDEMNQELTDSATKNEQLTEQEQELYDAFSNMYFQDAENYANAAANNNTVINSMSQNAVSAINQIGLTARQVARQIALMSQGTASYTSRGYTYTGGISKGQNVKMELDKTFNSTVQKLEYQYSEAELNQMLDSVINQMMNDVNHQIDSLEHQIGAIDSGIAALESSAKDLQDFKAGLGVDTSDTLKKKGSSGSGNKGSSGTGASSKGSDEFSDGEDTEYLERFKAEIDLYHDINIILGNIEEQLAKINKEQEKLTGADLIASLQKEAKLLEQQVVALENKVLLEEIEAMQLQNALKQQGVKFNQEGDISNYAAILQAKEDYVNNIISKYNYMTEEEQEAYKDTVDQAQEDYDAFVKTLQRYEEIMNNEIPDLEEQIQDAYNRQIEIQITQFDTKIQASLDLSEAEREWNEFKKKIIEGMDDEDIFGNAVLNFDNLKTYFADTEKSIPTLTQGLNQIIEDLKIINEGGEGSIFGDDEAAAIDSLKSYYEELMNVMEEVDELVKEIQQSYLDMLDEADEKFSKQIEGYEHIADIMNHGMNLTGLLYGDKAFAHFEHYYEQLAENNKKNLDFQRQEVEHWYKIMQSAEEGSDAWEKAKENFQDATAQLNSTVESAIENILSKYENAINQIFKNWEQNLTGGMSLDYLEEEWNLVNDNADDYLDKVNAAYEIRQLERKYQEAIDGTSSLAAQQKLNDLMTEELQMLQTKDKLSEYDVERANLKYQIALKELALDDAKKNKSQMRLRRDSQGNYSYQYVSDDTEISNAVDELEQLRNSLYNLDKNQLIENQNNILSSEQEFVSKLKDLYINYNVANIGETEEYLKQKELLEQQYQQKINNLLLENSEVRTNLEGSALEELAYMHGVNIESFQAMADAEREILMNQLIPQWDIGIADMISRINGEGGIAATMEELFIQLEEAVIQYGLDVRETLDAAGTSIDGYQGSIESLIDLNQELLSSNDDLIDSYEQQEKAILDLIESLKDLQTEYKGVKDEAIDALNAANALIMLQNKETAKAQSNANSKKPSTNSGSNGTGAGTGANTGTGTGGLTAGDIFSADDTKKPSSTNKNNTSSKKTESGDGTPSVGDKVKYISGRYYYDSTGTRPTGSQFQGEYVYITALNEKGSKPIHISTGSSLGNGDLGWLEKSQISGYDTGGYTGDWTGDKGRLALLHKKELVLKDTDTSNILDAVKIIRSINEVMFRNISSLATNIGTANSSIDYADKNVNQNVTIHAEFPGVSFAKEIEDAFSNLTNVASQHAYR